MVGPVIMRNDSRDQVLDLYERWTGKILLRPAQLPEATFTLTLDKPLPKSEALRALETLFNLQGIGFAPLGERFIKVSQLQLTRTEAPEFIEGSTLGLAPSGRIASKLFTLQFLRVGEFVPQISQLINPNLGAAPVVFDKTNAALVIESVSNLQRIEELIEKLDRPSASGLAVKSYPIVNAKASDVANQLRTLLGGPLAATIGTATIYQPDDRTNSLILISDAREQALFDDLVAKLDASTSPNTRSEVVFLKHATATEVEALLGRLVSGQSGGSGSSSRSSGSSSRLSSSNRTARTGATNGTTRTGANAPAPAAPTPNAAASAAVAGAGSEEFSEHLTIVADERSNAIVIAGTPNDIKLIKSLVDRLDVLLAQVRIEVVIAEVTLSDDASSGISELGLDVRNNKLMGITGTAPGMTLAGSKEGSTTTTKTTTGPKDSPTITETTTALPKSDFATLTQGNFELSGIIQLTTTPRKTNSSILQTPSIVTTHNKEAEIFVGETRPVISGTTSGSSGAATGLTSSSTVTQQEIGIRLRVLPLIGSSGDVQLEIEQEVEDVLGTVKIDNNDQPRIGRRTTTSYVSARNGDIIVLGGLQRASESRSTSRLGPIPWIGDLLGARSRSKGRTELIFFLRPTILTNTYLDNVEAMKRIDSTPQAKEVRAITDQRPAAAPYFEPAPAAKR
jgi:general secretion pathway protein D